MVLSKRILLTALVIGLSLIGVNSTLAQTSAEGMENQLVVAQSSTSWKFTWFLGGAKLDPKGIPVEIIDQGFSETWGGALLDCEDARVRHQKGICVILPLPLPI